MKKIVARLTETISKQINEKMNNSILVEALPEDLVNDIAAENIELSNEAGDNVEVLENKMTSAIGLMERILGEAFTTMRNK